MMTSILFVCTANRFRSPLAEAAFRSELQRSKYPGSWVVGSAGTWTVNGLHPVHEAIQAAGELGLDLSAHRSRIINSTLLKGYSLILVMQSSHKEALGIEFPEFMDKVFLLSEALGGIVYDIPDPFVTGEPPGEVGRDLVNLIRSGLMQICQLAKKLEFEGPSE
jgi:protein-tyrosine phosphatase